MVNRGIIGDLGGRDIGNDLAVVLHDHAAGICHYADFGPGQIPFIKNTLNLGFVSLIDDDEHSFLGFAQHDFIRSHAGGTLRNFAELDLDTGAGTGSCFAGRAGKPGGSHILNAGDRILGGQKLQTSLHYQLFHEGVAYLNGSALLLGRGLG